MPEVKVSYNDGTSNIVDSIYRVVKTPIGYEKVSFSFSNITQQPAVTHVDIGDNSVRQMGTADNVVLKYKEQEIGIAVKLGDGMLLDSTDIYKELKNALSAADTTVGYTNKITEYNGANGGTRDGAKDDVVDEGRQE